MSFGAAGPPDLTGSLMDIGGQKLVDCRTARFRSEHLGGRHGELKTAKLVDCRPARSRSKHVGGHHGEQRAAKPVDCRIARSRSEHVDDHHGEQRIAKSALTMEASHMEDRNIEHGGLHGTKEREVRFGRGEAEMPTAESENGISNHPCHHT